MHRADEECVQIFSGKSEGKTLLGRCKSRWEDDIKLDLREIGLEDEDWIRLSEDTVRQRAPINTVINFRFSKKGGKLLDQTRGLGSRFSVIILNNAVSLINSLIKRSLRGVINILLLPLPLFHSSVKPTIDT